ncbi:HU family DNA-binding protein [candidate division KSB1 bacterium]|nr:HU family DNA-binding protein [candidate division KSB1 bacterium]
MNTTDIIKNLSKKLGISQKKTREILKSTIESFKNVLVKGDQFFIREVGSFRVRERAGRKSFNAFIRRWMMIPPRVNVNFRPALKLRKLAKEKLPNE